MKLDERGAIVQFAQRAIKDFSTFYEAYAQNGERLSAKLKLNGPCRRGDAEIAVDLSSGRYSEAIFMLTGLLNDTNRFEDAATFARKGIDVDPGSWRGPFGSTRVFRASEGLKQPEEAGKKRHRGAEFEAG